VARQVKAGRWACHGSQTIALHTSVLGDEGRRWRALWEVGLGVALLDGVSALQVTGMTGFAEALVHVSVPHTATVKEPDGVKVHKVIRRVEGEHQGTGIPRTTPEVAAIRAAHWAVSDRQAALLLVMPVQQRLTTGARLVEAALRVRGRNRRALIPQLARDIADGAQSLGELDFAGMCRARGLPEPTRQALRRRPGGRVYLDAAWDDIGLVVEIDGSQHTWGMAPTDDQFRQNAVVIGGERVLRMTLLGLRLMPDAFMDQVCEAHARFGRGLAS
jgi:very-short-patch-repair endonuclease